MRNLVLSCLESRVERNRSIYARFVLAPFKSGDALTVGTALRRALLAQLEGIAITALEIQGVTHEFCTVVGVRESVLELSLNFQQIVLRGQAELKTAQVGYLKVQGPAVVRANDLKLPLGVECVDPTQHLATLARDGLLVVKFLVGRTAPRTDLRRKNSLLTRSQIQEGREMIESSLDEELNVHQDMTTQGALRTVVQDPAEKVFQSTQSFQKIIPLDSFSNPVNRANFAIQVDDLSNQERERLIFEIWTNGSIHPRQAIQSAVMSLVGLFSEFRRLIHLDSHSLGVRATLPPQVKSTLSKRLSFLYKSKLDKMSLLSSDLSNLSLSLKTYTFLKQKGIHKLETLLHCSSDNLLQLVNGNKNMFYDIKRCVCTLGLQLNDNGAETRQSES